MAQASVLMAENWYCYQGLPLVSLRLDAFASHSWTQLFIVVPKVRHFMTTDASQGGDHSGSGYPVWIDAATPGCHTQLLFGLVDHILNGFTIVLADDAFRTFVEDV